MKRTLAVLFAVSLSAYAQAPSTETLVLSLKTVNKALSNCRDTYTRSKESSTQPLLKDIIGADNYDKTLASLGHADKITSFLIAHPERISGQTLVAVLSTTDDFSIGVGSTRAAILARFIASESKMSIADAPAFASAAEALDNCQKNIFNAADSYVSLVIKFVGAEDDALAGRPKHRR